MFFNYCIGPLALGTVELLEIVEIIKPSNQGKTKPFLCRAEDDTLYYVKGANAGRKSQCSEWIVGHLAKAFGIPVAPFRVVQLSEALIAETRNDWQCLGSGPAFASEVRPRSQWFEPSLVSSVLPELRRDVLAFDWWVKNPDRNIDNPNLLWDNTEESLVVIDYDISFDLDLWPSIFYNYHIFSADAPQVFGDMLRKSDYRNRFCAVLSSFDEACDNVPDAWREGAVEPFDFCAAKAILDKCLDLDELWRME